MYGQGRAASRRPVSYPLSKLTRVACRAYTEAMSLCFQEPLPGIESSKEKPSWNNPSF